MSNTFLVIVMLNAVQIYTFLLNDNKIKVKALIKHLNKFIIPIYLLKFKMYKNSFK